MRRGASGLGEKESTMRRGASGPKEREGTMRRGASGPKGGIPQGVYASQGVYISGLYLRVYIGLPTGLRRV